MIQIIEMTAAQVVPVAELEKMCFSTPWSETSVAAELKNPLSLWLCAMDGEAVAGYIGSQMVPPEADMLNLAVSPDYRRQGIGALLTAALAEQLGQRDITSLTLEVRLSNLPAQRLYEKLGFQIVGKRPRYYEKPREDALILRKEWTL